MKALLLLLLPALLCGSMHASPNETGLEGIISMSPAHGGPIRAGEPDSRPLPAVEFVVMKGDDVVATFTTDKDGAFRVVLPPGEYKIARKNTPGGIGRFERSQVQVVAGEMKTMSWTVDSGLR